MSCRTNYVIFWASIVRSLQFFVEVILLFLRFPLGRYMPIYVVVPKFALIRIQHSLSLIGIQLITEVLALLFIRKPIS